LELLTQLVGETAIDAKRMGPLAEGSVASHEGEQRLFVQLVPRQHATEGFGRLLIPLLLHQSAAKFHERVDIHALNAVAMLEMPITRGLAVQEIAAKVCQ